MPTPFDVVTLIMQTQDLVGETGMSSDLAMIIGLLILLGGLVFWFLLFAYGVTALSRWVMKRVRRGRFSRRAAQ